MKFLFLVVTVIAILAAIFGAMIMAYQGQYFRCYLLILFIVMQVNLLAILMMLEREYVDPLNGLRKGR